MATTNAQHHTYDDYQAKNSLNNNYSNDITPRQSYQGAQQNQQQYSNRDRDRDYDQQNYGSTKPVNNYNNGYDQTPRNNNHAQNNNTNNVNSNQRAANNANHNGTNNQKGGGDRDQNYNGFMTHRDNDANNNRAHQQNTNDTQYTRNFNSNDQGSQKSLSLEYGKNIKLMRNGDEFFRGQKVVINSRKYRYFDVFLDDISDSMHANFGAVRNIHTPMHGHKIKSLDEIEDGKTYVASGAGRFVKLNYMDIAEGKRIPPQRLPSLNRQNDYSNIQVPQYDRPNNIFIYVYRNGDLLMPPSKILLYRNTLTSFDACLNEITEKVHLQNGAVLKLYSMEGEPVVSPSQLVNGQCYVAANKEKFRKCDYLSPTEFSMSPRLNRKSNSQPASHPSSNPSTSGKSNLSYPGKPYTGWHKDNNNRRENSLPPVSGPKPNSNTNSYNGYQASNSNKNQNGNKVNVDKDESGFYKARQNNDHAKTVPDNHNMYVDMPADYKKTKQVVHEEIGDYNNKYNNNNNQSNKNGAAPNPNPNQTSKANSKQAPNSQSNYQQQDQNNSNRNAYNDNNYDAYNNRNNNNNQQRTGHDTDPYRSNANDGKTKPTNNQDHAMLGLNQRNEKNIDLVVERSSASMKKRQSVADETLKIENNHLFRQLNGNDDDTHNQDENRNEQDTQNDHDPEEVGKIEQTHSLDDQDDVDDVKLEELTSDDDENKQQPDELTDQNRQNSADDDDDDDDDGDILKPEDLVTDDEIDDNDQSAEKKFEKRQSPFIGQDDYGQNKSTSQTNFHQPEQNNTITPDLDQTKAQYGTEQNSVPNEDNNKTPDHTRIENAHVRLNNDTKVEESLQQQPLDDFKKQNRPDDENQNDQENVPLSLMNEKQLKFDDVEANSDEKFNEHTAKPPVYDNDNNELHLVPESLHVPFEKLNSEKKNSKVFD